MKFELMDSYSQKAVIRVVGVGERGNRAVKHMMESGLEDVEFALFDNEPSGFDAALLCTVYQSPRAAPGESRLNGAAAREPALPYIADRKPALDLYVDCDLIMLVTDLEQPAAEFAARFAEASMNYAILTIAVVSRPMAFEGMERQTIWDAAHQDLLANLDCLITTFDSAVESAPTEDWRLSPVVDAVDRALGDAVAGVTNMITRPGLIGVDFADVRTVTANAGKALSATGVARGEQRARHAAEKALVDLRANVNLLKAGGWLVMITGSPDLSTYDFDEVDTVINDFADKKAIVVTGLDIDPELQDELRVTIVVTRFDG